MIKTPYPNLTPSTSLRLNLEQNTKTLFDVE